MAKSNYIDFDAHGDQDVLLFMRNFFDLCRNYQQIKNEEFLRLYRIYRNNMDLRGRDPNRSNIFVPKAYTLVETIMPIYMDALFGTRPFIPLELASKHDSELSDIITDLLDIYLDEADFFNKSQAGLKPAVAFGTGFLEATPDYVTRRVKSLMPHYSTDAYGNQTMVGSSVVDEDKTFFKLNIRGYAPWEVWKDPFCRTLEDCRGVVKFRGLTSKRMLKKYAERGAFPDFDVDKLGSDMMLALKDDFCLKMTQLLGYTLPQNDDDMGVWLSFESRDRYIDMWNFSTILRDIDNPFDHKEINLTRIINGQDPNPQDQWYGIGELKPIEHLVHATNENWNQTFDNHAMQNQGVIFYREDALSVDQLVMLPGNRIPIDVGPNEDIRNAVHERETPGLSTDHYRIPEKLELMIDQTSGINDVTRGDQSNRAETARQAILRSKAGESRIKLKIKLAEQMGMKGFGLQCLSIINQFASPDDLIDKLGTERAMKLPTVNPQEIDGGFRFSFKGADRMLQQQIKRQDAKDVYQLMAGNPSVSQEWLNDWFLQNFEISESERKLAVIPDQMLQQMQMMQQAQMMQQQMAAGQVPEGMGGSEATPGRSESTKAVSNGQMMGSGIGYSPVGGRHQNQKLGIMGTMGAA